VIIKEMMMMMMKMMMTTSICRGFVVQLACAAVDKISTDIARRAVRLLLVLPSPPTLSVIN